ncbi:MAG: twin-arginine translocase TatA/TatE family subunit [Bdellovibrionales bacterium]
MAPGPLQIAIVVLLILVVFGAGRVPMIAENLAKGINSFKKGLKDDDAPKAIDDNSDEKS